MVNKGRSPGPESSQNIHSVRFHRAIPRILGLLVLAALLATPLQWETILTVRERNGEMSGAQYVFQEENFNHPRLRQLRRQENLDAVVGSGKTQFEKIILLRHWTHQQWSTRTPFYYPPWDAVEILDLARKGLSRGFCAQYAIVFLQACQSMGIHARYIDLPGHFVVSVFSDDYDKWVIMDPYNDNHFERNGIPLGSVPLLHAYWHKSEKGIYRVGSDGVRSPVTHEDLAQYRMSALIERADQLVHPTEIVMDGVHRVLHHEDDYHRYPLVGRDKLAIGSAFLAWKESGAKELFPDRPQTSDPDDFRYRMDQTFMVVARRDFDDGTAKVILFPENSPTFAQFRVQGDDHEWATMDGHEILWTLHPGMNVLRTRIQTTGGWLCPVSELTVFYKPKLFHFGGK